MQAGWFTGAPRPGEPGPAVILGHVNGGGRAGIFSRLHELTTGDEILVRRTDGNTAGPELRLITRGGTFDRNAHSYRDNVIVYAVITA